MKCLLAEAPIEVEMDIENDQIPLSFAQEILQVRAPNNANDTKSKYIDLTFLEPTSVHVCILILYLLANF